MRIDVLARRWGGPDGGPDGMAVASAFLAHTLAEMGHDVRAFYGSHGAPSWTHPRVTWVQTIPLGAPTDFGADLIITTVGAAWRRTLQAAEQARAQDRLVFWHHYGEPPLGTGCTLAHAPGVTPPRGWARTVILPPSSFAAYAGGGATGSAILVPGASRAKGGHVALEVARLCRDLRFYVLPGRAVASELAPWRVLPHVEVAPGHLPPAQFLSRARAVLSPTRAEVHPLTLLEAAVRGIPVVCSDMPGTRAAVGEAGTFLPVASRPPQWAAALREALARQAPRVVLRPYAEVVAEALAPFFRSAEVIPMPVATPKPAPAEPAPAIIARRGSRPRVAILADVRTWAWARKSEQLRRHLSGDFDVEVAYLLDAKNPDPIPARCDLYHTFEVFMAARIPAALPYTTGITAHVWDGHLLKFGEANLRKLISGARAFHANSVLLVEDTRRRFGVESFYVPNGVDETFFRRTRPRAVTDRLVVGFQGKPNPRKGHALIVEACRLAGVELRDNVRTHRNALDAEGMREFYQDLHVLAVQSDMDGTPNSALEAAACGVAVVGNRIGNLPELIDGSNGVLVERSAASLAAALRALSPARAVEMGEAARRTIEAAWTWRDLSQNYARMWNQALGADRRAA